MRLLSILFCASLLLFAAGSCATQSLTHVAPQIELQVFEPSSSGHSWMFAYKSLSGADDIYKMSSSLFDDRNADRVMQETEKLDAYHSVHHPAVSWGKVTLPVRYLVDVERPMIFTKWVCTDGSTGSTVFDMPASVKSWAYGQDQRKGHSSDP